MAPPRRALQRLRQNLPKKRSFGSFFKSNQTSSSNEETSLCFVKQLLIAGISRLLVERKLLSESCLIDTKYEGLKIINKQHSKLTQSLVELIGDALDVIDQAWLYSFDIGIGNETCEKKNEVIEVYRFKFQYRKNGKHRHALSQLSFGEFTSQQQQTPVNEEDYKEFCKGQLNELSSAIGQAVKKLRAFKSRKNLKMKMKLVLNEDAATDYFPRGFRASTCGVFKCLKGRRFMRIRSSAHHFDFHKCFFDVRADNDQLIRKRPLASACNSAHIPPPIKSTSEERARSALKALTIRSDSEGKSTCVLSSSSDESMDVANSDQYSECYTSSNDSLYSQIDSVIKYSPIVQGNDLYGLGVIPAKLSSNCPCKITKDKEGPFMVCQNCKKYRHSPCFAFMRTDLSIQTESCHECSKGDSTYAVTTSANLLAINKQSLQDALATYVDSKKRASTSIESLIQLEVLEKTGQEAVFSVNIDKLKPLCDTYELRNKERSCTQMKRIMSPENSGFQLFSEMSMSDNENMN